MGLLIGQLDIHIYTNIYMHTYNAMEYVLCSCSQEKKMFQGERSNRI